MSVRGCTCRTGSVQLCSTCTAYATRAGIAVQAKPAPKPALPSLQQRYPEEAALRQLQQVADAAGWLYEEAWNPTGRFAGLLCHCLRGTEILIIQVRRDGKSLSAWQREWLQAWRATGVVEVWECTVETLDDVLNRLCEQENPHAEDTGPLR
jgi:hypothetical protein